MTKEVTTLRLDEIATDPRLQVRTDKTLSVKEQTTKALRLDEQHQRLLNCLEAGEQLDPIQVIKGKSGYLVFDGHHRLKAYADAYPLDNPEVPVEVLPWSYREALGKGHTVNVSHGQGLHSKELSQAALRACVYSLKPLKARMLVASQGISQSVAEKVTRAAKRLKAEAEIQNSDSPSEIDSKVSAWIESLPSKFFRSEGRPLFKVDDHGFPAYRFILERKCHDMPESDSVVINKMASTLEAMVDENYDAFRAALKKVAHTKNRDLKITIHRLPEDEPDADPWDCGHRGEAGFITDVGGFDGDAGVFDDEAF